MKEIKFRAWDNENKIMIDSTYGDFISFDGITYTTSSRTYNTPNTEIERVCSYELMQFTGLKDKNGVEIFADDLRKNSDGEVFRIYHVDGGFVIKSHYWMSDITDLVETDDLITESLSNPQTRQWIEKSTEHYGNIHDRKEEIK